MVEKMLPNGWQYEIIPAHMIPACAFQGLAYQYPSHHIARHWNGLRLIRLFANEVVSRTVAYVAQAREQGLPDVFRHCHNLNTETLQAAAKDYHIRLDTKILISLPQLVDEKGINFTPAARFLIWPLSAVAEIPLTSEPARFYAISCLYEIARQARIPQVLQAAKDVESGPSPAQ
jgi:hypothetical protein